MPIYIYRCENCGVQFERRQHFTDQPLTHCPECNKKALRKVYTPVGIVFKGKGFYATDNRPLSGSSKSKVGDKPGEKTGETKTESESSSSSTSESKE